MIRIILAVLACVLLVACDTTSPRGAVSEKSTIKQPIVQPPNFIIVLADDLGYGDLGCYGSPIIKTPNLDAFAREGLRLTSYYAPAPNCSPSRTGLLTGRTPYRAGIYNWIPENSPQHLRYSEITIANLLRPRGYATAALGKWHLNGGLDLPQPQPRDHGFDYSFVTQNIAEPTHHNPENFYRNNVRIGTIEGYSSEIVVDETVRWLNNKPANQPFFLYVCFHEPHEYIATAPRYMDAYLPQRKNIEAEYYGNVSQMDDQFGRLMRELDRMGLKNNTLVMFTSDNGPAFQTKHPFGSAGPLRDKKGSLYEGGIRVPAIIRFPGRVTPGSVSDEPVSGVDLLPTLCEITETALPKDRQIDGASIVPLFRGKPITRKTPLYWEFIYSHAKPAVAMRIGEWKLLATINAPTKQKNDITAEDMRTIKTAELAEFELYNLRDDIGETRNLAQTEPGRVAVMAEQMKAMMKSVQAEAPVWPEWTRPKPVKPGPKVSAVDD